MKIFILLLLAATVLVGEKGYSQSITISKKNAPLESIFLEISKQTGYSFLYNASQIRQAEKVTINVKNATLQEVLDICFKSQPFNYSVNGNSINLETKDSAQQTTSSNNIITGRITDLNNVPLPGANIRIRGMANGAVADINGSFQLKEVAPNAVLEITHVGYESQELRPGNDKDLMIRLEAGTKMLDEVITNGYRSTTKRDNLGSTTKIKADEISLQPVNNPLAVLQARVPGMIVTQRSGLPGAVFTVQIRGQRSIGTDPNLRPANSPLFIVDGVPFLSSSETLTQRSKIVANSPFGTINPADIESIEVLKDANATSIYGSLGANGVVLITTKKAQPGKTTLLANLYSGFTKITRAQDYMNTEQYIQMRKEGFANDSIIANAINAPDLFLLSTTRYTNWEKLLIGGSGKLLNANVRLTGGSLHTQFALGMGYNRESTVFSNDHDKTLTSVNFNLSHSSNDNKFELSLATSYGSDRSNLPSTDPTIGINTIPNSPEPYDSMGRLNFRENGVPFQNPLSYLYQPYKFAMERLTSGLRLTYKITPWLNAKTNAGYTLITADETLLVPIASLDPALNPKGQASFGNSRSKNWIVEPQLELAMPTGSYGRLKALLGTSFREQSNKRNAMDGTGYTNDASLGSIAGAATVKSFTDFDQYRVVSLYGLINYNFHEKYLVEATARRDGSSRFGPNRQFANFSSIALGWIFSKEKIMRNSLPCLSFGKLKASYGTTGNDQIRDYQFLDTWSNTTFAYQVPGFKPSRLANNDYRWELQKSLDVGIDLGFCKDKILLSATWNQSRTSDQLVSLTLPAQTGFTTVTENYPAVVQNKNVEFELNTVNIRKKNFKWTTSMNVTVQRNKLLKFPGIESTAYGKNKFLVGKSLFLAWGYRTAGLDPDKGVYRILDKKGNIIPIPTSLPTPDDLVNLGTYDRDYFGGLQNTVEYKNWQFQFLFQFVKQKGLHSVYGSDIPPGLIFNQSTNVLQRWTRAGDAARYQRYTANGGTPAYFAGYFASTSDLSFSDASFIRLKNVSLSYNLPAKWISKLKLSSCHVYIQCQNILTLTKFIGNDPEIYSTRQVLPPLRIFTGGIQLSL